MHYWYSSLIGLLLILFSCSSSNEDSIKEVVKFNDTIRHESVNQEAKLKAEKADSIPYYPSFVVKDSSWKVALDIQEGFLISFQINYGPDSTYFRNVDAEVPSIGGVDHPEPHFINDSTFLIPNVGSSPNGYFEMFISKNGNFRFNEIILKKE